MADYSEEVATADELIGEFGGAADLVKDAGFGGPDYDPTPLPPSVSAITIVDLSVRETDAAGRLTGAVTRTIYAKASSGMARGDKIRIRGVEYVVATCMPLQPAPDAQVIFYKATLEQ